MSSDMSYERPQITTIPANRILEMIGPVSCGSIGGGGLLPIDGGLQGSGGSGGYQIPST